MRFALTLPALLLSVAVGLAQPDIMWTTTFSAPGDQQDIYLDFAADGSAYLAANTGYDGLHIMHVSPEGDVLLNVAYDHTFHLSHAVVRPDNNLFLVGGSTDVMKGLVVDGVTGMPTDTLYHFEIPAAQFNDVVLDDAGFSYVLIDDYDFRVRKFSPELDSIWTASFFEPDWAMDLVPAPDGGVVAGGMNGLVTSDLLYLCSIDSNGSLRWSQSFDPNGPGIVSYRMKDIEPAAGGFLVQLLYLDTNNVVVYRFNWDGDLLETITMPNLTPETDRLAYAPDGSWLLYDRASSHEVNCVSSNGELIWTEGYGPDGSNERLYEINFASDRHPWVAGTYLNLITGYRDPYVCRLEAMQDVNVFVFLYPQSGMTIPPEGGVLTTTAELISEFALPVQGQVWVDFQGPQGEVVTYSVRPLTLAANTVLMTTEKAFPIPEWLPPGPYTFIARLGHYPNHIVATDSFQFVKQ